MNEKILARGKFYNFNTFAAICFSIAVFALILCFTVAASYGGSPSWAFEGIEYGYYWFFIVIFIFGIMGLIFSIMKFELVITEGKVVGKTLLGKRVDLPISQISVIGTGMFNRVSIATSSGSINFYGVINQSEIFSTISNLLSKRQEETKTTTKNYEGASDELIKLKDLLDSNIITQEEFNAKKKQILGL